MTLPLNDIASFDFVDYGTKKGSCVSFVQHKFPRILGVPRLRALCIEKNEVHAKGLTARGMPCMNMDAVQLELPPKSIRFVTMSHFLEHLKSLDDAKHVLNVACSAVTDFLYIEGPCFDFDAYLKERGLKFYWADWTGHPTHITISQITKILADNGITLLDVLVTDQIHSSGHRSVHPLKSPKDQFEYCDSKHPPKLLIDFENLPIFSSFIIYAWVKEPTAQTRIELLSTRPRFSLLHSTIQRKGQ